MKRKAVTELLIDNDFDNWVLFAPPLVSIFLCALYVKQGGGEFFAGLWVWSVVALMFIGGCWKAYRNKSALLPITAPFLGAVVGFAASQSAATVFADHGIIDSRTHANIALLGIYSFSLPAFVTSMWRLVMSSELESADTVLKRFAWPILVLAVGLNVSVFVLVSL